MLSSKTMKRLSGKSVAYDVVVIGGGPAGMMAAGQAASRGAKARVEKILIPARSISEKTR